ncbi:MAG: hypothetical protein U0031_08555 [Thermomicrobiales bacterium]
MTGANILVTGTPRSGTTLTCHLLNKLPDTLALHEPMKVKYFESLPPDSVVAMIEQFCVGQRASAIRNKRVVSKNVDGVVPDNPIGEGRSDAGYRMSIASKGAIRIDKDLSPDFTLVIKHNSSFTAMLGTLVQHFPVFGVIRNPLATLASWSSVNFNVRMGYAKAAERLDETLTQRLAAIEDDLDRQLCLLDWFHRQYRTHLPESSVLRYETVVESGGRALRVVKPEADQLDEPMVSRNTSKLYDHDGMLQIGERLLKSDGAYWEWYTRESVAELLEHVSHAPQEAM